MRVTKIVREYIEEQVGKAYATKTPEEIAMEKFNEMVSTFVNNLDKEIDTIVDNAIAQFRADNNVPNDFVINHSHYTAITKDTYNMAMRRDADKARDKRVKAKHNAIKDIILTLELGGTKADLDKMLKDLVPTI